MNALFAAIDRLPTYNRLFSLEDRTIQFTYTPHERVPVWLLLIITILIPLLIIAFVSFTDKNLRNKNLLDFHHGTLGLALTLSLTIMFTDVIKITVGRPRPDFIDRCQPTSGSHDAPIYGLSTAAICTWSDHSIIQDAFRSFPSGHSSTAFAAMTFLSLYLAGKLHMFNFNGDSYKSFIISAPLIAAFLVAISRTQDYRHHWQDVLAGGLLGATLSWFSYLQYYKAPWKNNSHLPLKHDIFDDYEELTDTSSNIDLVSPDTRV